MNNSRRYMLLGSAGLAASACLPRLAAAQGTHPENERGAAFLYGTRPMSPEAALSYQARRLAPPGSVKRFKSYVENLPLIRSMQADVAAGRMPDALYFILQWNHFALDIVALDHTKIIDPEFPRDPTWAEQLGPARASRALAIVHLAMQEAVNFIHKTVGSYRNAGATIATISKVDPSSASPSNTSTPLAICWSAYGTLVALYPEKQGYIKSCLAQMLQIAIRDNEMTKRDMDGTAIGQAAAQAVLTLRGYSAGTFNDGSNFGIACPPGTPSVSCEPLVKDLFPTPAKTDWQIDPLSQTVVDSMGHPVQVLFALGGYWSHVDTFVLDPASTDGLFLPPPPPAPTSPLFAAAYKGVFEKGGDDSIKDSPTVFRWHTPTTRTGTATGSPLDDANETFKAQFWGYDGTSYICAPPRLYNEIATSVALGDPTQRLLHVAEMTRYLATVNVALADAAIGAWTAKFKYHLGRPITWIRENPAPVDVGSFPTTHWTPLGQVSSNAGAGSRNTTPPFPSYPSGHAVFGGTLFTVMRRFWGLGKDANGPAFRFMSDEYNGYNRGSDGQLRPAVERHFSSFTAAETENAESRVWLGIHWQFDADAGITQGREIGNAVFDVLFKK